MCPTQDPAFTVLRLLTSTYRIAHIFAAGSDKSLCGRQKGRRAWQVAVRREWDCGSLAYSCGTCWPIYHTRHDPQMRAFLEQWERREKTEAK